MAAKKKSTKKTPKKSIKKSSPRQVEDLKMAQILKKFEGSSDQVRIKLVGKAQQKKLIAAVQVAVRLMEAVRNLGVKYSWVNLKYTTTRQVVIKRSLYQPETFKQHLSTLRHFIWDAAKLAQKSVEEVD